jgi:GDP-4-dehydro-6-deoxy-D-mannose reductase
MKVLITGGAGFVGGYLVPSIKQEFGQETEIVVTSKIVESAFGGLPIAALDVTDSEAVFSAIRRHAPTHVVHLAGLAAIPAASAEPQLAWQLHLFGTLNLAHAIMRCSPKSVLLFIGSGQVYGASARSGQPLTEQSLLAPTNEYAVTKAAADLALGAMAEKGLRCVRLRPFNHTGPRQNELFAIPSFAMQIARIEAGQQSPTIHVGNLEAERDFLDVRDVASAYSKALARSDDLVPGAIYNIASGAPRRVGDLLNRLLQMSKAQIIVAQDEGRLRAVDTPRMIGDAQLARRELGWRPQFDFDDTLKEILNFARAQVAAQGAPPAKAQATPIDGLMTRAR